MVGVAVCVAVMVGVAVCVAVMVGVAVCVAVCVGVAVCVAVCVGVAVCVAVCVGVAVGVAVGKVIESGQTGRLRGLIVRLPRLSNACGMSPHSWLPWRNKYLRLERSPNSDGMVPVN